MYVPMAIYVCADRHIRAYGHIYYVDLATCLPKFMYIYMAKCTCAYVAYHIPNFNGDRKPTHVPLLTVSIVVSQQVKLAIGKHLTALERRQLRGWRFKVSSSQGPLTTQLNLIQPEPLALSNTF